MPRVTASAEEIQAHVSARIHESREVREDGAKIRVPRPYRHETDEDGANWNMDTFGNARGYEPLILAIVADARERFLLEDR